MNISELFTEGEDRAVSPVIGVILMVAITVILAAVIGTFVLGLGDQVQTTAPNAQFSFDFSDGQNEDVLTVTHEGGDGIEAGEVALRGDVASGDTFAQVVNEYGPSSKVRAGSSVEVGGSTREYQWTGGSATAPSDAEVRVVWEDADSDQSSTLRTWTRD